MWNKGRSAYKMLGDGIPLEYHLLGFSMLACPITSMFRISIYVLRIPNAKKWSAVIFFVPTCRSEEMVSRILCPLQVGVFVPYLNVYLTCEVQPRRPRYQDFSSPSFVFLSCAILGSQHSHGGREWKSEAFTLGGQRRCRQRVLRR